MKNERKAHRTPYLLVPHSFLQKSLLKKKCHPSSEKREKEGLYLFNRLPPLPGGEKIEIFSPHPALSHKGRG
jgi:hypothetical protein